MANLTRLPVATLESVSGEIINDAEATGKAEVTGCALLAALKGSKESYTQGYNKLRGSTYTAKVQAADESRDDRLVGLRTFTLALTYSWDSAIQTAARNMLAVLNMHGTRLEVLPLDEESGKIHKLLSDLGKQEYAANIQALGLQPWISALGDAQSAFEAVSTDRTTERASASDIASASAQRKALQLALTGFIKYVEAMDSLNADAVWHGLLTSIQQRLAAAEAGIRNPKPDTTPAE
jgi:hypothetical protein